MKLICIADNAEICDTELVSVFVHSTTSMHHLKADVCCGGGMNHYVGT